MTHLKKAISLSLALVILLAASLSAFAVTGPVGTVVDGELTLRYFPIPDNSVGMANVTFEFSDSWFSGSAYDYNHGLAKASLIASIMTNNMNARGDGLVISFLDAIGCDSDFTYTRRFGITNENVDDCAFAFGVKRLGDTGKYLVAVLIRGIGYGAEWSSNVRVYEKGYENYSYGFRKSAEVAYGYLNEYLDGLEEYGITRSDIKIWINGYSRGSAITNNLGQMMTEDGRTDAESIFVYGFAVPATVLAGHEGNYRNLFSICSELDIVPRVPLVEWGFTRFGTTMYLPCSSKSGTSYSDLLSAMQTEFSEIMDGIGRSDISNIPYENQEKLIDLTAAYLGNLISSPKEFKKEGWQQLLDDVLFYNETGTEEEMINALLDALLPNAELIRTASRLMNDDEKKTISEKISSLSSLIMSIDIIQALRASKRDSDILNMLKDIINNYRICLITKNITGSQSDSTVYYSGLIKAIADIIDLGIYAPLLIQHWPEAYLAWMDSGNEEILTTTPHKSVSIKHPVLIGDVNGDGDVDEKDVSLLNKYVLTPKKVTIDKSVADIDGNGKINLNDVLKLTMVVIVNK